MSPNLITVESGVVTTIRLNNPPLNLVSLDVTKALGAALSRVEADDLDLDGHDDDEPGAAAVPRSVISPLIDPRRAREKSMPAVSSPAARCNGSCTDTSTSALSPPSSISVFMRVTRP